MFKKLSLLHLIGIAFLLLAGCSQRDKSQNVSTSEAQVEEVRIIVETKVGDKTFLPSKDSKELFVEEYVGLFYDANEELEIGYDRVSFRESLDDCDYYFDGKVKHAFPSETNKKSLEVDEKNHFLVVLNDIQISSESSSCKEGTEIKDSENFSRRKQDQMVLLIEIDHTGNLFWKVDVRPQSEKK